MRSNSTLRTTIIVLILAAALAAAVLGYGIYQTNKASADADKVIERMKTIIPGLGAETEATSGDGRDPLSVMTIENIDVVGCIEVPSIDVMVPVTAKGKDRKGFATYLDGSAVKGQLRITGKRDDIFGRIVKLKPGDKAAFTDMDGFRYTYSVLTQFHLKKWDRADYDLMLCYETDDKTRFVVGLNRE